MLLELDPRTYSDSMAVPTEVAHSDESERAGVVLLTDRQSNPALHAQLLKAIANGFSQAEKGIKDVHPMVLKQKQRHQKLQLQKAKEAVQQKLAEQARSINSDTTRQPLFSADQKANGAHSESNEGSKGKANGDSDDDDIFADAGEYHASDAGEDSDGNTVDDKKEERTESIAVSSLQNFKVDAVLYYNKPAQGIDTVRVIKLHPGLPAPTESLTVRVVSSYDPQRVGRELNLLPRSEKLSSTRPIDPARLVLFLPHQFRKRCQNTPVEDERAWANIEVTCAVTF